jgi:hypothetical protein
MSMSNRAVSIGFLVLGFERMKIQQADLPQSMVARVSSQKSGEGDSHLSFSGEVLL